MALLYIQSRKSTGCLQLCTNYFVSNKYSTVCVISNCCSSCCCCCLLIISYCMEVIRLFRDLFCGHAVTPYSASSSATATKFIYTSRGNRPVRMVLQLQRCCVMGVSVLQRRLGGCMCL